MAIFYYSKYKEKGRLNFGDDINPFLLGEMFDDSIIRSERICLVGVGTILNNNNIKEIEGYEKKVVFSSGVGYGPIRNTFDGSWDVVCVRGPKSAELLGVEREKAICDGAILLADVCKMDGQSKSASDALFIPHIDTAWVAETELREVCGAIGVDYLAPDAPMEVLISQLRTANLVITEAMHGAIVADAFRVPWVPVSLMYHDRFKWSDWAASVNLPYRTYRLWPHIWDGDKSERGEWSKKRYKKIKRWILGKNIRRLCRREFSMLSETGVIDEKKKALWDRVAYINERYKEV